MVLLAGFGAWWQLRPAAVLTGIVVDGAINRPVGGAQVRIVPAGLQTVTDGRGRFHLEGLPSVPPSIEIAAPGFSTQQFALSPEQWQSGAIRIALTGEAALAGTVVDRLTGEPVPGALVGAADGDLTVRTGDEGTFQFIGLRGGEIEIHVSADGYRLHPLKTRLNDRGQTPVRIELAGDAVLTGTIVGAASLQPIPEAVVRIVETSQSARTDRSGKFRLEDARSRLATILVEADGFRPELIERDLDPGRDTPIRVALRGTGAIAGRVETAAGRPVADAEVRLLGTELSVRTNSSGRFQIEHVPGTVAQIAVSARGYRPQQVDAPLDADRAAAVSVVLTGEAGLTGTVVDAATRKVLAGADVRIETTGPAVKTGGDGTFRLAGVPSGTVRILAQAPGYRLTQVERELDAGEDESLELELHGGTILSGLVVDAGTGRPIDGAQIRLDEGRPPDPPQSDRPTSDRTSSVRTQADGRFRWEELAPGAAVLIVSASGYRPARVEQELEAGKEAAVRVKLSGPAALAGQVVSALDGEPIAGATVRLNPGGRRIQTDENGQFLLEGLPSGPADIEVTAAGFLRESLTQELADDQRTEIVAQLAGSAVLSGAVVDAQGRPVSAAAVQLEGRPVRARTGRAGRFRLDGLPPGPAALLVSAKGFRSERIEASLSDEEPTTLPPVALNRQTPSDDERKQVERTLQEEADGRTAEEAAAALIDAGGARVRSLPDEFEHRLAEAGAQTGDVQVSLLWNNVNDLDLHVRCPSGEVIYYGNRRSGCRGDLDVDRNANGPETDRPVENVYWPAGRAPQGKYVVAVHHYANHGAPDPTEFEVAVKVHGQVQLFRGKVSRKKSARVCEFVQPNAVPGQPLSQLSERTAESDEDGSAPSPRVVQETESLHVDAPSRQQTEQTAAMRLRLAEALLEHGRPAAGAKWFEDIQNQYPDSAAAQEAGRLLEELRTGPRRDARPAGGTYLADLTPRHVDVLGQPRSRNRVILDGVEMRRCVWTRPFAQARPATIVYRLDNAFGRFTGAVGINPQGVRSADAPVSFRVEGDGRVLWKSGTIRQPGQVEDFDIDVSRVRELALVAESQAGSNAHALWFDPWLTQRRPPSAATPTASSGSAGSAAAGGSAAGGSGWGGSLGVGGTRSGFIGPVPRSGQPSGKPPLPRSPAAPD